MKKIFDLFLFLLTIVVQGQCIDDYRYKCWSKVDPISVSDFMITSIDDTYEPIQGQFGISYEVKNLNVFKKNFNKNVKNLFLKKSSEIDTTKIEALKASLAFVQLQFDLSEIHVRRFRKELYFNRKRLLKDLNFVESLQEKTSENFISEKKQFIEETKNGTNQEILKQWRIKIEEQLEALIQFSAWNDKKIKL